MTDELEQLLKALRLRKVAEILDDELVSANKEERSYQDFLARLLRAQCAILRMHHLPAEETTAYLAEDP